MFSINDTKAKKNRNKVDKKKKKHESIMAAKVFEKMRMRKKKGIFACFAISVVRKTID